MKPRHQLVSFTRSPLVDECPIDSRGPPPHGIDGGMPARDRLAHQHSMPDPRSSPSRSSSGSQVRSSRSMTTRGHPSRRPGSTRSSTEASCLRTHGLSRRAFSIRRQLSETGCRTPPRILFGRGARIQQHDRAPRRPVIDQGPGVVFTRSKTTCRPTHAGPRDPRHENRPPGHVFTLNIIATLRPRPLQPRGWRQLQDARHDCRISRSTSVLRTPP